MALTIRLNRWTNSARFRIRGGLIATLSLACASHAFADEEHHAHGAHNRCRTCPNRRHERPFA